MHKSEVVPPLQESYEKRQLGGRDVVQDWPAEGTQGGLLPFHLPETSLPRSFRSLFLCITFLPILRVRACPNNPSWLAFGVAAGFASSAFLESPLPMHILDQLMP